MDKSELLSETVYESVETARPSPALRASAGKRIKRTAAIFLIALIVAMIASSTLARKNEAAAKASSTKTSSEASPEAMTAEAVIAESMIAQAGPARAGAAKAEAAAMQAPSGGRFNHTSSKHSQIKCDNCHARKADAVKPTLPGHRACISCHIKEFTATGFGICNNCHDGIKAVRPAVVSFPARQSFGLEFKKGAVDGHITHATVVNGEKRSDCTGCHQIAGARATFPGHKQCYTCHKAPEQVKAGEKMVDGSCGVCHTTTGDRTPFSAAGGPAYRFRFNHQEHVRQVGDCTECHKVLGGELAVSQPGLSQHRGRGFAQSCGNCHNGRRAFGGEIVNNACARCHGRPMM